MNRTAAAAKAVGSLLPPHPPDPPPSEPVYPAAQSKNLVGGEKRKRDDVGVGVAAFDEVAKEAPGSLGVASEIILRK